MNRHNLTCFNAYDISGHVEVDIDENVAYRIGRAVAPHLKAKAIVVGFYGVGKSGRATRVVIGRRVNFTIGLVPAQVKIGITYLAYKMRRLAPLCCINQPLLGVFRCVERWAKRAESRQDPVKRSLTTPLNLTANRLPQVSGDQAAHELQKILKIRANLGSIEIT